MVKFTIPLIPRTKKNSLQMKINPKTKKPYPAPSKAFEQFQRDAGWYIPLKGEQIDKPVNVKCEFYFKSDVKVDLLNLLSAVCDILVHYRVLDDDNSKIVVGHDGSRVHLNSDRQGVDVEISEADDA